MKDSKCAHCVHCNEIKYDGFFCDKSGYLENKRREDNCPDFESDTKPEVRHGRWIPIDSKIAKCSCCGWWQHTKTLNPLDNITEFALCYRYCTACGAHMVETGQK